MSADRGHVDPSTVDAAVPVPWPPSRRARLLQVWAVLTLGLLVRALAAGLGPIGIGRGDGAAGGLAVPLSVDPNRASVAELATLPGLGPQRAAAIVLHRVRHGPFRDAAELARVDGIGPGTLEQLRPHVQIQPVSDRGATGSLPPDRLSRPALPRSGG